MQPVDTRHPYTLAQGTPRHDADIALRGALIALRHDMDYLSVSFGPDSPGTAETKAAQQRLSATRTSQGQAHVPAEGPFSDDLDPRNFEEFIEGLILAPYAEHAMSISRAGAGEFASYEGAADTRLALTQEEFERTCAHMAANGSDPRYLVPWTKRR